MWLGVDVGGSGFRAGLVDEEGNVSMVIRGAHDGRCDAESVCERIARAVNEWTDTGIVEAVGVGVAAWVKRDSGVVESAPNLPWKDVDFGAMLRGRLGIPVRVVNDLKAIAWGEFRFGAGRGAHTMTAVFVGTGVGSATVEDGRLVMGAEGFAGEVGHVNAGGADGVACGCGMRGCLEAYVGARALLAGEAEGASVSDLEVRANGGDGAVRTRLENAGERLGRAVGAAVMVANPDVLVWGGGVWGASAILREATTRAVTASVHPKRLKTLRIADAVLGERAGIVGAATLASGM